MTGRTHTHTMPQAHQSQTRRTLTHRVSYSTDATRCHTSGALATPAPWRYMLFPLAAPSRLKYRLMASYTTKRMALLGTTLTALGTMPR